jgi:hypothetical protein
VWRYNKKAQRFTLLELPTKSAVADIAVVHSSELVAATETDGFFTYNLKTEKATHYSHMFAAISPMCPSALLYVDKKSEVWG